MLFRSEEEYARRAANADRVAVFKEFLADRETPVAALSRLGDDEEAFLLESVAGGETRGRYSYLGLEPYGHAEGAEALAELRQRLASTRYVPAPVPGCVWNATPRSRSPLERNLGFWTQA